jgi:hypothetical protein
MQATEMILEGNTVKVVMNAETRERLHDDNEFIAAAKLAAVNRFAVNPSTIRQKQSPVPLGDPGESVQDLVKDASKIRSWSRTIVFGIE